MEWSDDAIVLSSRAHGENGAILELLTATHGRHLGLVRGGASRRMRPTLQPGNTVRVHWRARLEEHLGSFTCELVQARAGDLMESRAGLAGLNAFAAVCSAALPERLAHKRVHDAGVLLLGAMLHEDTHHWLPLYIRWEMGLLEALGFGLDLSACAVTGSTDDLIYVSPRSGRAVSRAGAGVYADRLFLLPGFLSRSGRAPESVGDIAAGLKLTGHFLLTRVLGPHGKAMPPARTRLDALLHQNM